MYQQPLFVEIHQIKETAQAQPAQAVPNTNLILPELLDKIASKFVSTLSPETIRKMNGRLERGLDLAKSGHVAVTNQEGFFKVLSSQYQRSYRVDLNQRTCTCPDSEAGYICKHRIASWYIQQAIFQSAPDLSESPASEEVSTLVDVLISCPSRHDLIYAVVENQGKEIPVEILDTNGKEAYIRALPNLVDGDLVPVFPFRSPWEGSQVKYSTATISGEKLSKIRVYHQQKEDYNA